MAAIDREWIKTTASIYLPQSNVLTDAQMDALLDVVIGRVGDSDDNQGEVLCKFMELVADTNLGKVQADSGTLKSEKLGDHSRSYDTTKDLKSAWRDFKKSLSTTCPLYGYSPVFSLGFKINSGGSTNPITECPNNNSFTL